MRNIVPELSKIDLAVSVMTNAKAASLSFSEKPRVGVPIGKGSTIDENTIPIDLISCELTGILVAFGFYSSKSMASVTVELTLIGHPSSLRADSKAMLSIATHLPPKDDRCIVLERTVATRFTLSHFAVVDDV
jgi:hypothetical protein